MAAVSCYIKKSLVNLSRFGVVLRPNIMLSRSYFLHNYMCNQSVHFKGRFERYTPFIAGTVNMPNSFTQRKVFRPVSRCLAKSAHSIKQAKEYRSNNAIKAKHVRLIDQEGKNLGIMSLNEALKNGKKENCMVVEVRKTSSETVCKLINQKQLYEKIKEEKKKHVKTSQMKAIKVTGKISEHDLDIKLRKIIEFLEDRDSVKVFVAHRRLQNTSVDDKKALIEKIAEQISDVGCLQGEAKVIDNGVRAIFVPLPGK